MKHTVATCAHILEAPQWRLVDAELAADVELEVTHGRQADESRRRREAWGSAARGERRGRGHAAQGTGHGWHAG